MEAKGQVKTASLNYGWVVACAGFFMHLCLGTMYCWGAFTPYITSYLRKYNPHLTYNDTIIVFMLIPAAQTVGMPIGGTLMTKIGPRYTALIGCWIMAFGVFVSAFATTVFQTTLTYGIIYGLGMGMAYMCPIACGFKWLPTYKGLLSGIVVTGFGLGGAIFNIIGAAICNPGNKAANPYFGDDVADNVPRLYMTLGCIYAACTSIGALLLRDPTAEDLRELRIAAPQKDEEKPLVPQERPGVEVAPVDFLKDVRSYMLWVMMTLSTSSGVLVVSTYKTFGAIHGFSDQFLTIIGSLCLVFNGFGRLLYGYLNDKIGFQKTMMVCFFSQACIALVFVGSTAASFLYTIVVCSMILNYGANFPLYPTVTAEIFGKRHVAANYGIVFSGFAAAGILLKLALSAPSISFGTVVFGTAVASGLAGVGTFFLDGTASSSKAAPSLPKGGVAKKLKAAA
uniref:Major facilitator superfamily (MFS) profile domain-containing protein n=1 Tax=Lotharella oceanica TaxID=641309 RepID=A0A7S2X974_9EUKA